MARNSDPGRLLGTNMPQASVIENLAVPHIGAQRRESQGDNYRRLASSFGRLSSALMSFGSGWAQYEKAQKKDDYDRQWTEAVVRDAEAGNNSPRTPEAKAAVDAQLAHGYDPRIKTALNLAELEKVTIPALAEKAKADIENSVVNKFMVPTGREIEEVDQDGGRYKAPEMARLTSGNISDMRKYEHLEVDKSYAGNTEEKRRMRLAAKAFIDKKYEVLEASLRDYTEKENREKVAGITRMYMTDNAADFRRQGVTDDALFGKLQDEAMSVAKTLGATRYTREHAAADIIDGLDQSVTNGDLAAAQITVDLYNKGKLPNGAPLGSHDKFGSAFHTLYVKSSTVLQKAEHEKRRIDLVSGAVAEMSKNKKAFGELGLEELSTKLPGTTSASTTSVEKIKKAVARELEAEAIAPGGVAVERDSPAYQTSRVIRALKGTGLVSEVLKARADALTLDYDTDRERVVDAYSLYSELKANHVGNIKDYFDADRLHIMEDIEALKTVGYDEAEAARLVYTDRQEGESKLFAKSMFGGELFEWIDKNNTNFTPEEISRVQRAAKIVARNRQFTSKSEVKDVLDSLAGVVAQSKREVLDAPFEAAPGEDADISKAKVEFFMEHPAFKGVVSDPSKYRLKRGEYGWTLIEKGAFGRTMLNPKTHRPLVITDSEVTQYWSLRQALEKNRKLTAAQKKLLDTYGKNGVRQLQQRIEADKRAEEEAYISP